jgi:hypothetical protein
MEDAVGQRAVLHRTRPEWTVLRGQRAGAAAGEAATAEAAAQKGRAEEARAQEEEEH